MTTEEIKKKILDYEFIIKTHRHAPKVCHDKFCEFKSQARLSYAAGDFDEGDLSLKIAIIFHDEEERLRRVIRNCEERINELKESVAEKGEQK